MLPNSSLNKTRIFKQPNTLQNNHTAHIKRTTHKHQCAHTAQYVPLPFHLCFRLRSGCSPHPAEGNTITSSRIQRKELCLGPRVSNRSMVEPAIMHPALHPTTHTAEEGTPHGSSGMDRAFAEDHGGSSGGGGGT